MAQVKERGGLVLVSFLPRSKPKVPLQELFLLRNQTETLAIRRLALTIQTPVKFSDFVEAISSLALVQRSIGSSVILL